MVQRMHELITALKSLKSISVLRDAFSAEICMLMRESLISSDFNSRFSVWPLTDSFLVFVLFYDCCFPLKPFMCLPIAKRAVDVMTQARLPSNKLEW